MAAFNFTTPVSPTSAQTGMFFRRPMRAMLVPFTNGQKPLYCFRGVDSGWTGAGVEYVSWTGTTPNTSPPAPPYGGPVINIVYWRVK